MLAAHEVKTASGYKHIGIKQCAFNDICGDDGARTRGLMRDRHEATVESDLV